MKISVIMPVYNTKEEYLREAIESILNQTFQDFELLIIDDCSTTINVKNILNSYNCDKIVYLKTPQNSGASGARNYGLKHASGEYIAILDSDDIALPTRFEKQINYLENHPTVGVLGSWAEPFPNQPIWKPKETFSFFDLLKAEEFIIHSTIMMRKSILDSLTIVYDPAYELTEDYRLWTQLIHHTKIKNIQEVLVKYRMDVGMSFKSKEDMIKQRTIVQQKMLSFLTADEKLQEKLSILLKKHGKTYSFKKRIKYIFFKLLWLLFGKSSLFEKQMKNSKKGIKNQRYL